MQGYRWAPIRVPASLYTAYFGCVPVMVLLFLLNNGWLLAPSFLNTVRLDDPGPCGTLSAPGPVSTDVLLTALEQRPPSVQIVRLGLIQ